MASKLFRASVLVWLLLFVSLLPAAAEEQDKEGKNYALLIGVSLYNHWTSLVNPVPDVYALSEELQNRYGFLTEVLENPTVEEIVAKLRRYFGIDFGPEDRLVIVGEKRCAREM